MQTTHFVKSRAHSPRPTSKIIAMIALRRAILMKANPMVSLHAHRLFSGRACSCKKDPCCECVLLLSTQTKQHHGKSLMGHNFWQRDHSSSNRKAKLFFPFHAATGWKARATFLTNQEKSYLLTHSRALRLLQAFALIFYWFNRLTSSIVIG